MIYYNQMSRIFAGDVMLYKAVPKKTIKRLEETEQCPELENMIIMLELCRESNDVLWKQLILLHLDDLRILNGKEGRKIRNEIRRKLQNEL